MLETLFEYITETKDSVGYHYGLKHNGEMFFVRKDLSVKSAMSKTSFLNLGPNHIYDYDFYNEMRDYIFGKPFKTVSISLFLV